MLGREPIPKSEPENIKPVFAEETVIKVDEQVSVKEDVKIKIDEPAITVETIKEEPNDVVAETKPAEEEKSNSIGIVAVGGLGVTTARDCMICGEPFMEDWQHKEYNMCSKCRSGLKKLLSGE